MASFKLPALDEIKDDLIPEGDFPARFTDWEAGMDGYGNPAVKFSFKFVGNTAAAGKNTDIRFVKPDSQWLVDIVTGINGGQYDPSGDLDDYIGNGVILEMKHVTKTQGKNAGKTYSNVINVKPHPKTQPKVASAAGSEIDDFNVDDEL